MMLHRHFEENEQPRPPKPKIPEVVPIKARKTGRKKKQIKAAVYCGTQKLYADMVTAAKSLLCNSDVDKIYFLIETDRFPYELHKDIECINVGGQTIFDWDGPNTKTLWTYMILMRVAFTKLFPDLDKIVSLDVDTVVVDDVSGLWDVDMDGCVLAMANESYGNYRPYGQQYFNCGVTVYDLAALRETGLDDEMIHAIQTTRFTYPEQDAMNLICSGKIKELDSRYNDNHICGKTMNPAIVHYIAKTDWATDPAMDRREYLLEYRGKSLEDVSAIRLERYGKK